MATTQLTPNTVSKKNWDTKEDKGSAMMVDRKNSFWDAVISSITKISQ